MFHNQIKHLTGQNLTILSIYNRLRQSSVKPYVKCQTILKLANHNQHDRTKIKITKTEYQVEVEGSYELIFRDKDSKIMIKWMRFNFSCDDAANFVFLVV
jgi:hypothetical protein